MSRSRPLPSVGAVVVNFNGGEKVVQCLRSLRSQAFPLRNIIVVDNGSTDDSVTRIGLTAPDARVISLGENRGLPFARNVGLQALDTALALSVDADVYLAPDCVERLVAAQVQHGAAVVCPRLLLLPEGSMVQCDGAALHFLGTLALRHAFRPAEDLPRQGAMVGGCIGACMLMDRALVLQAGGFDELFFFYFEDLEFCLRMRARGHRMFCEPTAIGHHDRGEGTPGLSYRGEGRYPARRAYLSLRHRWLAMLIHYRTRTLLMLGPALALYETAALGLGLVRGWFPAWARGWWWLFRHRAEILERRRRAQAARTCGDHQLLEGGPIPLAPGLVRSGLARRLVSALSLCLNGYWRLARPAIR